MSRWIDAEHLRKWMLVRWESTDPYTDRPFRADEILAQIDRELSIDIICCGECKHWNDADEYCEWFAKAHTSADDFCSYGSRSEKPNNCDVTCEIDGHYIGYIECFEDSCKHWAKDKWQEERSSER